MVGIHPPVPRLTLGSPQSGTFTLGWARGGVACQLKSTYLTFLDDGCIVLGGEKNAFSGQIFGSPLLIVDLISIQHGDIIRFTKKCGFTPNQWPFMNQLILHKQLGPLLHVDYSY